MIYDSEDEVSVFLYTTSRDVPSDADYSFEILQEAEEFCDNEFGLSYNTTWIQVPDPMNGCQHDIITPVRAKGMLQWGTYEKLVNGNWIEFKF